MTDARLRPVLTEETTWWFDGLARGELLIQRCAACGSLRHPPRPMCAACRAFEWTTTRASGAGEIHSFVVHGHDRAEGPTVVGLVTLAEGTRLVAELVDVRPGDVSIGMAVEVRYARVDDDLVVARFTPAVAA